MKHSPVMPTNPGIHCLTAAGCEASVSSAGAPECAGNANRQVDWSAPQARRSGVRYSAPAAIALALCLIPRGGDAHPLQAEPINHPYVFTFDQFFLPIDPDEQVQQGGLLLMAELSCTSCHAAPEAWQGRLSAKQAPDLSGVGSRLDADAIWLMVRSPQHRKKGTLMPGLFAGEEGDDEKVEALTEYLSSVKKPIPTMPQGDVARGKELYHSVGCVACHEPATDYRPSRVSAGAEPEKPALGSVPMALADAYDVNALASFLHDPLAYRPAGRMPSLRMNEQESADIAAYLHIGRKPEPATERAVLKLPKQTVAKGREIFMQQGCASCHSTGEPMQAKAAKPMTKMSITSGCLSTSPRSGTPRYGFNELQVRALKLALQAVQQPPMKLEPMQQADWQMSRLNCYACHDRDGKGGPEDAREQYFASNDPGAESLGAFAHVPPSLDRAGRKLTPQWFEKVLWGEGGSVRPYLNTRMPSFGRANTESLIAMFAAADKLEKPVEINVSGVEKHHRAELGRKLMGTTGVACVTCHGLKERKSLGPPVIRLTHTVERLQPEYFKELLLNPQATQTGSMMPPLFMARKARDKEIESIWTYLRELDGQPLPEGLLSNEDYELKPAKEGRTIIFRSFIEGVGTHAIGVGFPQGWNAAFDAKTCQWKLVWKGRFLDAMSNWQERDMKPIKPLGSDVKEIALGSTGAVFRGYRLEADGSPVMLYDDNGVRVEDRMMIEGDKLTRVLKRGDAAVAKEVLP